MRTKEDCIPIIWSPTTKVSLVTQWQRTCLQWRRHSRHRFDFWVRRIPLERKWQPTSVFLSGKPHGQSLVGCSLWGCKPAGHSWAAEHAHTQTQMRGKGREQRSDKPRKIILVKRRTIQKEKSLRRKSMTPTVN